MFLPCSNFTAALSSTVWQRLLSRFKNLRLNIQHCLAYDVDWLHLTDRSNRTGSTRTAHRNLNQNLLPKLVFYGSSFQFLKIYLHLIVFLNDLWLADESNGLS